ncbi:hypothetical protein [Sphingobium aquiterrae]|uniref:hypothetical protein n=1 Tax=Sphingobium aquiterrae TaxID=2038656 RepID=UPI0030177C31
MLLLVFAAWHHGVAEARERDQRLHLHGPYAVGENRVMHAYPLPVVSLSPQDRLRGVVGRSRMMSASLGNLDVSLRASRMSSGPSPMPIGMTADDRWTGRKLDMRATLSLGTHLWIAPQAAYTKMTRRLGVVPVTSYRLGTAITDLGVAVGLGDACRITLDHIGISRSNRRRPVARFAETLGGAPLTGQGNQLAVLLMPGDAPGAMSWRLSVASMRRPAEDMGPAEAGAQLQDRRATMSWGLRF